MTRFLLGLAAAALGWSAQAPDLALYESALQRHVRADGAVAYAALRDDLVPLDTFVRQLGAVSPDSHPQLFPRREQKLAYWLNAYNALVLWAFAKDYPKGKDRLRNRIDQGVFFYGTKFRVGGKQRSLDDIETNTIRKGFGDPRIHFALVCASASCPRLAREAYRGDRLDDQLEARTRLFVNETGNVRWDDARGIVTLSKIFEWYEGDFGGGRTSIVAFLYKYHRDGPRTEKRPWKTEYFPYDWSLNDSRSK
ncbi:MAG: DUF547 domain-containing protein [Bryobacterales bacterium]|nr:DUF547 domain-containing protein [Bryobacterales bacterium]